MNDSNAFKGSVWTFKKQTKLSYSIYHSSTLIYNTKVTCKLSTFMFFFSLHAHTRLYWKTSINYDQGVNNFSFFWCWSLFSKWIVPLSWPGVFIITPSSCHNIFTTHQAYGTTIYHAFQCGYKLSFHLWNLTIWTYHRFCPWEFHSLYVLKGHVSFVKLFFL